VRRSSLFTITAATAALCLTSAGLTAAASAAPARKIVLADKITNVGHPVAGSAATFKLAAALPAGDKIKKFTLNWGDHSKIARGTKFPTSVAHKYALPGTYTVVLSILDKANKSATTKRKVVIGAVNLLVDGNAEAGPAATDDETIFAPPGWTTTGEFTTIAYGASDGFPDATTSKPISGGKKFFGGGNTDVSTATQDVVVAAKAASIDAGAETVSLSGDLGGWDTQSDYAQVSATFLDADGVSLGAIGIGPVTEAQRGGNTELLPRSTHTRLPAGTRTVQVVITSTRTDGEYDDGYSDNIALSLAP
jgi:hypothetical protein